MPLLHVAVQEFEQGLVVPLIQKWSVKPAPVLTILPVVIFGIPFGVLDILVATLLMIVAMVLVRKLYVEGARGGKD